MVQIDDINFVKEMKNLCVSIYKEKNLVSNNWTMIKKSSEVGWVEWKQNPSFLLSGSCPFFYAKFVKKLINFYIRKIINIFI